MKNSIKKEATIALGTIALGVLFSFQSFAQSNGPARLNSNGLYTDNGAILQSLETKANEILKSGNFLNAADARKQLAENLNKKVKIKKLAPHKIVLNAEQIAAQLKASTLIVGDAYLCGRCDNTHVSAASGYVIDESGIFVTNHHVIESYTKEAEGGQEKLSLQVMTSDGKVYPVTEILSASKEADLAIVKLDIGKDKLIPLPLGNPAELGAEVYVMSNPNSMFYYFSKGVVARNYMKQVSRNNKENYPEMEITADYAAGSSGAAVVDNMGNAVATVSTTSSIYYHPDKKTDLQMVVKGTKPVVSLQELIVQ